MFWRDGFGSILMEAESVFRSADRTGQSPSLHRTMQKRNPMTDLEKLKQTITVGNLVAVAGSTYFQRGEGYADDGLVRNLHFEEDQLCALVDGTSLYETVLFEMDGELEGECDCPLGRRDEFCKHLVATGLAWLALQEAGAGASTGEIDRSDGDVLEGWLKKLKKAELVELIQNQCLEDLDFFDRMLVRAAGAGTSGDLGELKRMIQQSYRINGFVDWRNTGNYYRKLEQVDDTLRGLLESGQAGAVIELVEYAMKRWETAIQHIDDSDGGMGMVRDELHELHRKACRMANPDPVKLAERLFKLTLASGWEMFYTAYDHYADIWKLKGRNRYRELVEVEWNKLPRVKPGEKEPTCYGTPGWLSRLMVQFTQEDDDFERELEILQRDLSGPWNFHKIVDRCEEMKQLDRAVEWLEKGIGHYQGDNGLEEKCVELYWKQKRHDEALAICWKLFERRQTLDTYKRLVIRAKQRKVLEGWRAKALESIRAGIAVRKKEKRSRYWYSADHSLLVGIFLWEGDHEQAWQEALSGDCSTGLWLELCRKREQEHPGEVFPIYLELANKEVERRNNDAYHSAVQKIKEAGELAARCNQSEQFDAKLESIRTAHKPKRNFMKYLVESGL